MSPSKLIRRSSADASQVFRRALGVTLLELLVVIAIIGALIALLLPAVQAARESSRLASCSNSLRQIGLASLNHLDVHKHFPSGGWGGSWTGDPRRGYGPEQPGGWIFNILDYLEQDGLRKHIASSGDETVYRAQAALVMQHPIDVLICPSRRQPQAFPHANPYLLVNSDVPEFVARSDYAINAGDTGTNELSGGNQAGPTAIGDAELGYPWPASNIYSGVSHFRSRIRAAQVQDGLSKTFLIGEKYLATPAYYSGTTQADRGFALIGYAPDTVRMTSRDQPPAQDATQHNWTRFGSAHSSGCQFVLCDSSVRIVSYDIDPRVYRATGNRHDGEVSD
jgi:type II secretory pathway pseudopilin PulG